VDFNGDEIVDVEDLLMLIDAWGTDDPLCDIGPFAWGDGVVDAADLEVLMSYWGQEVYDPTLLAHWAFDEVEGDIAYDSVGKHDGIVHGAPLWQPEGGVIGGALLFDGVDDCVETPLKLNPSAGPFSVFARVLAGAPGQVIVSQAGGAKWLMVEKEGVLATELPTATPRTLLASQVSITDGNWHRVGLTWDGSVWTLYVDDVKVAEDVQPGLEDRDAIVYIGASGPTNRGRAATFFSGLIDDVRIYNRAVRP